jgi:hypothetical protein
MVDLAVVDARAWQASKELAKPAKSVLAIVLEAV